MEIIYGICLLGLTSGLYTFLANYHKRPHHTYNVNVSAKIDPEQLAKDLGVIVAKAARSPREWR